MISSVLFTFAKGIFGEVLGEVVNEKKDPLIGAVTNVISDTIESMITGEKTIEEWADIAVKGVDKVKEQKIAEENLQYIDGRLCIQISDKNNKRVIISFQLYFLDENNEWKKVEASSDILASNFTPDALEELKSKGKCEFEYHDFMSDYRSPWVFNKILQKP